jgi:hypothetical protein
MTGHVILFSSWLKDLTALSVMELKPWAGNNGAANCAQVLEASITEQRNSEQYSVSHHFHF